MLFNAGDRVKVIEYPDNSVQIGSEGTVKGYDGMYWSVVLDDSCGDDSTYGYVFEPFELELIPVEQPYDPTQMGDKDDDI